MDTVLQNLVKEGARKFIANTWIALTGKKVQGADFISEEYLMSEEKGIHEHMVPKSKYINEVIIEQAKAGFLTEEFVFELLKERWFICMITKREDMLMNKLSTADPTDYMSRYLDAGILIRKNPNRLW